MMRVLIIGAGGHAQVVADILLRMQERDALVQPIGYLDDNPMLWESNLLGLPVLGGLARIHAIPHDAVIIAIGHNQTRHAISAQFIAQGECLTVARHPSAIIASDARIGAGSMVCAGVVINPGSVIGDNVILNTGCSVDHHNHIGDYAHIAPGSHLGGEVDIQAGVLVGIGATVMPCVTVGAWSIVGAGACVTHSVPAGITVVGVPAKPLQKI